MVYYSKMSLIVVYLLPLGGFRKPGKKRGTPCEDFIVGGVEVAGVPRVGNRAFLARKGKELANLGAISPAFVLNCNSSNGSRPLFMASSPSPTASAYASGKSDSHRVLSS
jgi:hypothetical protein